MNQNRGSCCCSVPSRQLAFLASLKSLKFPLFLLIANEIRGSPAAAWNAVLRLVSSLPSRKRAPFSRGSLGLADGSFFPPQSYMRSVQSAVPIGFSKMLLVYSAVRSCGRLIAPVLGVLSRRNMGALAPSQTSLPHMAPGRCQALGFSTVLIENR